MGARSEWTRPVNHLKTDLEDTEGVQLEAEAFSVEAEVGAVVFLGEVETEAMVEADLTPEVGDTVAPETITAAAGVKVDMVTDLQEAPIETAMTVMLHTTSKNPS